MEKENQTTTSPKGKILIPLGSVPKSTSKCEQLKIQYTSEA